MPLNAQALSDLPAQLCWAELGSQGGLYDQKIKKGTFISVEKVSF